MRSKSRFTTLVLLEGRQSYLQIRVQSQDTRTLLERDDFSSNRHPALSFCLSMIFSENRYPLFRIMLLVQSGHWPQRRPLLSASTETRSQKNAEIVARHGVPKLWSRLGILPIHHRCATSRGLCQRQRQRGTNCLRGISHGHGTRATNGNPVHQASQAILHSRKHKISRSNPDVQQGCNRKS